MLDNPLGFPVALIPLDGHVSVLFDLVQIPVEVGQLPEEQVAVNHSHTS